MISQPTYVFVGLATDDAGYAGPEGPVAHLRL